MVSCPSILSIDTDINKYLAEIKNYVVDGEHFEAALSWRKLRAICPQEYSYYVEECLAFQRCYSWAEAHTAARAMCEQFPTKADAFVNRIHLAIGSRDFDRCLVYIADLRERFSGWSSYEYAASFLDEAVALIGRYQFAEAAAVLRDNMDNLLAVPQRSVRALDVASECFDLDLQLAASATATRLFPEASFGNHTHRTETAIRTRAWMQKHAAAIRILSLGQNCLPWYLPNRWGLRTDPLHAANDLIFNLIAHQHDKTAAAIETDFADYANPALLKTIPGPGRRGLVRNEKTGISFAHETGPYWLQDNARPLIDNTVQRIENFRATARSGPRIFMFALIDEVDLSRLIMALARFLVDPDVRIMIVNLTPADRMPETGDARISYLHQPYPTDYLWSDMNHYNTDRGVAFEKRIADHLFGLVEELAGVERGAP